MLLVVESRRHRPSRGAPHVRRPGVGQLEIDAGEPAVYVGRTHPWYGEQVLLQIVYTVLFPENRIARRATLAPDGEPLDARFVFGLPEARP